MKSHETEVPTQGTSCLQLRGHRWRGPTKPESPGLGPAPAPGRAALHLSRAASPTCRERTPGGSVPGQGLVEGTVPLPLPPALLHINQLFTEQTRCRRLQPTPKLTGDAQVAAPACHPGERGDKTSGEMSPLRSPACLPGMGLLLAQRGEPHITPSGSARPCPCHLPGNSLSSVDVRSPLPHQTWDASRGFPTQTFPFLKL